MAKPSSYELELIQKITRAASLIAGNKREHTITCPATDPHMPGKCTCNADETNAVLESVLQELAL